MMKIYSFILVVLFSYFGVGTIKLPTEKFHREISEINDVGIFLMAMLNTGVKAEEVLVLFDVDGTLTNCSEPKRNKSDYPPRKDALELLQWAKSQQMHLVVSSAARNFVNTLRKLRFLGLAETLGTPLNLISASQPEILHTSHWENNNNTLLKEKFISYQSGSVISVRKAGAEKVFMNKAHAIMYSKPREILNGIKRIVVIDDREDYLHKISSDLKTYFNDYYLKLEQIDYWKLTAVSDCG